MRYSCVKCQRFFKIKRNGVLMEEGMPTGSRENRGEPWVPYKAYMADLYECEKCGTQLAVSVSYPITEHYMATYNEVKDKFRLSGKLLPMVEDC